MPSQHRVVDHIVEHLARTLRIFVISSGGASGRVERMADGYSRGGAGLGVVAATSGGGALNLVPGLGESLASRVPVLALVGQPATTMDGRGSFQDTQGALLYRQPASKQAPYHLCYHLFAVSRDVSACVWSALTGEKRCPNDVRTAIA